MTYTRYTKPPGLGHTITWASGPIDLSRSWAETKPNPALVTARTPQKRADESGKNIKKIHEKSCYSIPNAKCPDRAKKKAHGRKSLSSPSPVASVFRETQQNQTSSPRLLATEGGRMWFNRMGRKEQGARSTHSVVTTRLPSKREPGKIIASKQKHIKDPVEIHSYQGMEQRESTERDFMESTKRSLDDDRSAQKMHCLISGFMALDIPP
ncbi:hypothetical protein Tco_0247728 [Tanacetum coccineum]